MLKYSISSVRVSPVKAKAIERVRQGIGIKVIRRSRRAVTKVAKKGGTA